MVIMWYYFGIPFFQCFLFQFSLDSSHEQWETNNNGYQGLKEVPVVGSQYQLLKFVFFEPDSEGFHRNWIG
jgi:hypothetical protein